MKVEMTILNSRIARRIFLTFVASSLIPVVVLAALSLMQVSAQLESQGHEQLRRVAKGHGLSIFEHLLLCDDELLLLDRFTAGDMSRLQQKFSALGRRNPDGSYESLIGPAIPRFDLTAAQIDHLEGGNSIIVVAQGTPAAIVIARYVKAENGDPRLLVGRVQSAYLWGLERGNLLPPLSEFAVVDADRRPIYHSLAWKSMAAVVLPQLTKKDTRVKVDDTNYLMVNWPLFLESRFGAASWHLVVLQPETVVMAPVERFKTIFLLVVVLALLLVVALSLFNLRRSLGPIDALKAGARSIAHSDFDHRVHVRSRDEFQELADNFNTMAGQLGRQFRFLHTQEKINHATLMANDFNHTAGLAISRILKDFNFSMVAVARINAPDPDDELIYRGHANAPDAVENLPLRIDPAHLERFDRDLPWLTVTDRALLRCYLTDIDLDDIEVVTLFPVFVKNDLYALLYIAGVAESESSRKDFALMRQVADHLAVAWSNVNLIRDLRRLTVGSMQALARAVDAKSPWTAGHSARVMRIALSIGRHMQLGRERIDRLEQAALLHDIGKIGISARILDKPGRLNDDEYATIRQHPAIGDTILSPIEAFKPIIPTVRQHHERWDGRGYPDGLAGDDIVLEARILAVADVYDAMTSDRPYRQGMPLSRAMQIIREEAGHQFDPAVVNIFLELMDHKSELAA